MLHGYQGPIYIAWRDTSNREILHRISHPGDFGTFAFKEMSQEKAIERH